MVTVTYLSSSDLPIGPSVRVPLLMSEVVTAVHNRDWSQRREVWAIRITDGVRTIVRRKPTDAYGPRHLPLGRGDDPQPKIPEPRKPSPGSRG